MEDYLKGNIYEDIFGIQPGINLMGIMTALGGSTPPPEVIEAAVEASKYFVDMRLLLRRSGEVIAKALGVPAAYITSGSSAGLTLSAAACLTGTDNAKFEYYLTHQT
jgi:L-seryl-tRNA(Ser) seleniumtransferase